MSQFISICVLLLCAGIASAQTSTTIRLGVYGAFGGTHAEQSWSLDDCLCPHFDALSGTYAGGGVVAMMPFTTGEGLNVGWLAQLGYHGATLAQSIPGDRLPSLDQDGNVVYPTTEYRADIKDDLVMLDLAVDLVLSGVTLDLGASVGYRNDVKGQTTYALTDPPGAKFDPYILPPNVRLIDSATAVIDTWDEETTDDVVIGPYASLGYRFVIDNFSVDLAAETRLLWTSAIPNTTVPMWMYGGILRVMYAL
jgi:hypothetical protein